jgi:CubicO group peptidase (beta-lactamase class C family)
LLTSCGIREFWTGFLAVLLAAPCTGADPERFAAIDDAVTKSIAAGEMPGAVILVLHEDQVVYRKAFGLRAKAPAEAAMTADTLFDLASLTKPVAAATAIFYLIERGKLRLDDPVAKHWREFGQKGKESVTVEQCLLHTSGLVADNPVADYAGGTVAAMNRIAALALLDPPGTRFRYSDVGYIVLGHLVVLLDDRGIDGVFHACCAEPLKMNDTLFLTPLVRRGAAGAWIDRIAPTERDGAAYLMGIVHDPRARQMERSAGHAGLFSTVDDLAVFCRMVLHGGELGGKRLFKSETIRLMTEPIRVPGGLRTRGWDCDTRFSANRGKVFPAGKSFGHTGFTGTSMWIDPGSRTAVIFLSNRLHPDGKGNVARIRGTVATLAGEALGLKHD